MSLTNNEREELEAVQEFVDELGRDTFIHVSHRCEEPYQSLIRQGFVTWRKPTRKEIFSPSRFRMVRVTGAGIAALADS